MKKIRLMAATVLLIMIVLSFSGCGKSWTCDWCGRTWKGDAYYGSEYSETLCSDCANKYWSPFPISNYKK